MKICLHYIRPHIQHTQRTLTFHRTCVLSWRWHHHLYCPHLLKSTKSWTSYNVLSITSEMIEPMGVIGMDHVGPPFESQFNVSSMSLMFFALTFSLENKEVSHVGPTFRVGGNSNLHIVRTALVDPWHAVESINARILWNQGLSINPYASLSVYKDSLCLWWKQLH